MTIPILPVLELVHARDFHRPRGWRVMPRFAVACGGETVRLDTGTWLLDLGPVEAYAAAGQTMTEHRYRLPDGSVVASSAPLGVRDAKAVDHPQAVVAMNSYRSLAEILAQDHGLSLDRTCDYAAPFRVIKCPLCHGTRFVSLDFASTHCTQCNARFRIRPTAGDPGFVVDCSWADYWPLRARYILPQTEELTPTLVLKDSGDPCDMGYEPERCDPGHCHADALWLTGNDLGLRPGLHRCRVGTLYDWNLYGDVPTVRNQHTTGWQVDGVCWPACATIRIPRITHDERSAARGAAHWLGDRYPMWAGTLAALAETPETQPHVLGVHLPAVELLREGEYFLLHRWAINRSDASTLLAWPIWYVVEPRVTGRHVDDLVVRRRDICPECGEPVTPEAFASDEAGWDTPHRHCRERWRDTGWGLPAGQDQALEAVER